MIRSVYMWLLSSTQVPVGAAVADSTMFDKLASWPSEDNVIRAESLEALTASNQTVNQILTGFCTNFVP